MRERYSTPHVALHTKRSHHQRAAIEIDDRAGGETIGHEGEDLLGDVLAQADALTGSAAAVLSSISRRAASGMAARIGVSMMPGETQLTRTGASSSARLRVSNSSAPLAAPTMAEFGRGRMLRKPETSVSEPPGADVGRARAAPGAPELAFHRGAHVLHRRRS